MADVFNVRDLEDLLKGMVGTGSEEKTLKAQSKSQQQLAKLQGEIQKQLAAQQAEYAKALAAQQAAAALEAERERQAYGRPFQEANLTGYYNGQQTLAGQQLATTIDQFNRQYALDYEMQTRQQALAELSQQQENAIAQGNLDLAREIQTRQVQLQEEQQKAQQELDRMKLSGVMDNGYMTEEARQAHMNEAMQRAQTMGYYMPSYAEVIPAGTVGGFGYNDERSYYAASQMAMQAGTMPQGQMTDAAQQWRTQAGLDYARTAAQLSQNPADYFESAAYMRNANETGALGFLDAINKNGLGSNIGFRSAGGTTPQTNSTANLAAGGQTGVTGQTPPVPAFVPDQPMYAGGSSTFDEGGATTGRGAQAAAGPSPSLTQATNVANGTEDVYQTMMHASPIDLDPNAANEKRAAIAAQGATPMPAFMTPGVGAQPSMVNATSSIPGGTSTGVPDVASQRLAAFQPIFQAGAHKLAAGALESMSPTEKGLFTSAAKASGINPADLEQQYKRTHTMNTESAYKA